CLFLTILITIYLRLKNHFINSLNFDLFKLYNIKNIVEKTPKIAIINIINPNLGFPNNKFINSSSFFSFFSI
ncbi:hypothetical protein, partial [Clostridium perfringens]|uniref:hypothetical protein n=1 Tax=Clostridium perfringens TaxID=1502 RepID=UPI001A9A6E85